MNELIKYEEKVRTLPIKVEDVRHGLTIKDLPDHDKKIGISSIMYKYLSNNVKGKGLLTPDQVNLVTEFIINDCSNLQLEEINLIFRNGVLGRYGTIFNDISMDVICGKDGWIEQFYKNDRPKRKEVQEVEEITYTGNEMTLEQFYEKYPEEKKRRKKE